MPRRVGSAALAALIGGATALLVVTAGGANAGTCGSWTDAPGDASKNDPAKLTAEDDLDLVKVSVSSDAATLTIAAQVKALSDTGPDLAWGDGFATSFSLAGKTITVTAARDVLGLPAGPGEVYTYLASDGTTKLTETGAFDVKTSTVSVVVKKADLVKLAGKPIGGLPMTAWTTTASENYSTAFASGKDGGVSSGWDTAAAPTSFSVVDPGSGCGGGGVPVPSATTTSTPTASPSPTASPTPTPTTSPTPTPTGTPGADPMKDFPLAGCSTLTDPKSDGKIAGNGSNDPDLDITALTLRTTATDFLAYVNVDKLTAGTATADGQRYAVDFTFNKHVFSLSASSSAHGTTAARDAAATSGLVGHVVQLGVDAPSTTAVPPPTDRGLKASGLKATYDLTNSRVVFSLPIADIVKYGGAAFAGPLTAVDAKSQVETNTLSLSADTAGGTATWTVGDNKCFIQKTAIKLSVVKKGISRTVTAVLSAGGTGLAKQVLTVAVNGKKVGTITTDATGKAAYTKAKPNQTVTISFAGASGFGASTASTKV